MIDFFEEIYIRICEKLREEYEDLFITNEYVRVPPMLPHICVQEIANTNYRPSQDSNSIENHTLLGIQIDIYTKGKNKKYVAKTIYDSINDLMINLKFNRVVKENLTNIDDDSVFRIVLRYETLIGKNNIIYSNY